MSDEPEGTPPEEPDPQTRLLGFIRTYITTHGYPPSVRECSSVGPWKSPATALYHLHALERGGRIHRGPGARMITITDGDDTEDKHG